MGNAFLSSIPFAFASSLKMSLPFNLFAYGYLLLSIASIIMHSGFKSKMIRKLKELDSKILELVKTDEYEFKVLKEYDKLQDMKVELKRQEDGVELQKFKIENQKILIAWMVAEKQQTTEINVENYENNSSPDLEL